MKRMFLFLCLVLVMCRTPTFGALTYDQNYYVNNRAYLGAGNFNDPLYNLWGTLEGLYEGTSTFDAIELLESTGATYYTKIQGGDQSANLTLTLPTAYAASNGYVLSSTTTGTLSWVANAGTFAGGNITSDCTLSNGVDLMSTTSSGQAATIKVYDNDTGPGYTNVLSWTNGNTPAIAMGSDTSSFAMNSTTIDVSAGAITGVTGLSMTGNLALDDSGDLILGTNSDFTADSDTAATLDITPAAEDESATINFGSDTIGINLKGFAATASDYAQWNAATEAIELVGAQIHLDDDSDFQLGTDKDFWFESDVAKNLDLVPAAASDDYIVNIGLDQSGVDVKMFGATTGEYWSWDAGEDSVLANLGNVSYTTTDAEANQWKVDATGAIDGYAVVIETTNGGVQINADGATYGDISVEAGDDLGLTSTGDTTLTAANFYLGSNGEDVPTVWYAETTGAEMTATGDGWTFDGMTLNMNEGDKASFGDGGDLYFESTSNVLTLGQGVGGTGTVAVGANNKGIDTTFYSENDADKMWWDQDGNSNVGALTFVDAAVLFDQTNADYTFAAASDAFSVTATDHSSAAVTFGASGGTHGLDVILQTHTAGAEVTFDAGADTITVDGVTTIINEGDEVRFGDGGDLSISSTANLMTFGQVVSGTGSIAFGVDGVGVDCNWPGENEDDNMLWDQDGNSNTGALIFEDAAIVHDQANVDYTWVAASDRMSLLATDHSSARLDIGASGGSTNAIDVNWCAHTDNANVLFDGGNDMVVFEAVDITMNDNDSINFGDSAAESTLMSDGSGTDWTLTNGALTVGDGGSSNYSNFAVSTGVLTFVGTARPTKTKYIPAQSFTAIDGSPVLTTEVGTNMGIGFAFDPDAEEAIATTFVIPYDWAGATDVTLNIYWASSDATGTSHDVVWDVNSIPLASDEDMSGATPNVDTITDALVSGTAWDLNVSQSITVAASTEWTAGDMISLVLFRDADNAADDCDQDVVVFGVLLNYTSDEP